MKKSFRILALVMALMTALGAASFASADMPTNYVGVTTVEDTDFFYQGPGTNYDFVQGKNQVTAGTKVAIYSITADGKWCYIGFSIQLLHPSTKFVIVYIHNCFIFQIIHFVCQSIDEAKF